MPKTYVAQKISNLSGVSFAADEEGKLTSIITVCEVNYGEMGQMETVDILPLLTDSEKQKAQVFYDKVMQKVTQAILG